MSGRTIQRILVVELLGGIGDVVLALPAVHALARSHPWATTTVLTFRPGGELLEADPWVTEVLYAERGDPTTVAAAVHRTLAERDFDLVVSDTMYGGIDDIVEASLAPYKVTNLWQSPPPDELIDLRFLRLLTEQGLIERRFRELPPRITLTEAERSWARKWLGETLPPDRPRVALVPDAGMPIKRWGADRFARLARHLVEELEAAVVVPVAEETDLDAAIAAYPDASAVLPPSPLRRVAAVLHHADLCVAADTGLARVAAAVGTRTIALYGPTWAGRFGLRPPHINVQSPLECPERKPTNMTEQACWYSGRCIFPDRQSCMDDIPEPAVLRLAAAVLRHACGRAARPS